MSFLKFSTFASSLTNKRKIGDKTMKKYVVEIVEKVTYKVEVDAVSSESAENIAREMYDSGILEGEGELESVSFDVESK